MEKKTNIIKLEYKDGVVLLNGKKYHLYFTNDDEIKEGDWFITNNILKQCIKISQNKHNVWLEDRLGNQDIIEFCRKVIVTTDKSLKGVPQLSKTSVEWYCMQGGVDEVMVEYESKFLGNYKLKDNKSNLIDVPKVNSHNEITIHPIKDNYSREEMLQAYRDGVNDGENRAMGPLAHGRYEDEDSWIEKNL